MDMNKLGLVPRICSLVALSLFIKVCDGDTMVRGKFTNEKGERRSYLFENQMDINLGGSRTKLRSQSQDRASVGVINDRKVRGGNMIMCPPIF